MASAAAATVLVVGVGAAGLALSSRHDAHSPLSPGAENTVPVDTAEQISSTTMATHATADPQQVTDARAEAWRAAVYQEMASFGTCAITESGAGSGALFSSKVICNHFSGDQPVDGNRAFVLTELPANLDTSSPGWQQKVAGDGFTVVGGAPGDDSVVFVETSNGTTRRVAIVTRTHVVLIAAEMIADKYLPTVDALTTAARHLNDLADSVLAAR